MCCELELTKTNRLRLARAFQKNKRVDYSTDCVIEGQMGKAFADSLIQPRASCITAGPFWYFAGEAHSIGGYQMMGSLPPYCLFMTSPAGWLEVAQEIFGENLQPMTRYRFYTTALAMQHLEALSNQSPCKDLLVPLDAELTNRLIQQLRVIWKSPTSTRSKISLNVESVLRSWIMTACWEWPTPRWYAAAVSK